MKNKLKPIITSNFHNNCVNTTFGGVANHQTVPLKQNQVHETLHLRKRQNENYRN